VVATETAAVLEKFREEAGEGRRAADGPEATLQALAMSQVGLLLVHEDPDDSRTAWFGPDPGQVGLTSEEVKAMGVDDPQQARLTDVALRAALGTGADVRVVPSAGGPTGGLGAILRWS